LEKLQFLTDAQIENLLYYKYMYFPMESAYELKLIDGFYGQDIRNLLPFVYVGKADKKQSPLRWGEILKYGKNELIARADNGLETKEGYRFIPEEELQDSPNKQYVGDPYYYSLRYRFRYSNRIYAGLSGEKDAGEQAWGKYNKGFDSYNAYFQINDVGKFKTLVVGDYGVSFGQGLVVNTNYGFGKSAMVLNIRNQREGLHKYSSLDEYNFFRGIGSTIKLNKQMEITAFYSTRMLDADTTDGQFSSILTDGKHRTLGEIEKKNTVNMQVLGLHGQIKFPYWRIGLTALNTTLDQRLQPTPYPYNYHYFSGNEQNALSVDYQARWHRLFFFGETAYSDKAAYASLNGVSINPFSTVSLVVLHRYYSPEYDLLFANAFGETSRNNNEEGLYFGVEVHPFRLWKFSAYADSYRFPWLKYGIDAPSDGYDALLQADYTPSRDVSMYIRFRAEQKQDNVTNDSTNTPWVDDYDKGSLRYVLQYAFSDKLKLRHTIEGTYSKRAAEKDNWGYLLGQDLSYHCDRFPLNIDLRYEIFDATNYENLMYSYEKDVLYAFSVPMLYGKGTRYYINMRYDAGKNISVFFKIAQTTYLDKDVIGTELEEIRGNKKTDMRLVLRWKW
jgi:hypothetical protein